MQRNIINTDEKILADLGFNQSQIKDLLKCLENHTRFTIDEFICLHHLCSDFISHEDFVKIFKIDGGILNLEVLIKTYPILCMHYKLETLISIAKCHAGHQILEILIKNNDIFTNFTDTEIKRLAYINRSRIVRFKWLAYYYNKFINDGYSKETIFKFLVKYKKNDFVDSFIWINTELKGVIEESISSIYNYSSDEIHKAMHEENYNIENAAARLKVKTEDLIRLTKKMQAIGLEKLLPLSKLPLFLVLDREHSALYRSLNELIQDFPEKNKNKNIDSLLKKLNVSRHSLLALTELTLKELFDPEAFKFINNFSSETFDIIFTYLHTLPRTQSDAGQIQDLPQTEISDETLTTTTQSEEQPLQNVVLDATCYTTTQEFSQSTETNVFTSSGQNLTYFSLPTSNSSSQAINHEKHITATATTSEPVMQRNPPRFFHQQITSTINKEQDKVSADSNTFTHTTMTRNPIQLFDKTDKVNTAKRKTTVESTSANKKTKKLKFISYSFKKT